MERTEISIITKTFKITSIILLIFSVFLIVARLYNQLAWQATIPDGEIVYSAGHPVLGFVHPDGIDNQDFIPKEFIDRPTWSDDGKILFGLSGRLHGQPAYWDLERGRFKVCNSGPSVDQVQDSGNPENPYEVVVMDRWEIAVMDLSRCKEVQQFVDYYNRPNHGDYSLAGFSFFPSEQALIYGLVLYPTEEIRKYKLFRLDIETGEEVQIGEGINPAWSPDGSRIAYLGIDGLYTIDPDGTNPLKLLDQLFFEPWRAGSPWSFVSPLRWSPDGEWLIYSRCTTSELCGLPEAQIYKIPVIGGSEELIVEGGRYPCWGNR